MSHPLAATALSATLLLAGPALGSGPSEQDPEVTEEQLAYSKQMYAEGDAAMQEGDFTTALTKFREGYRYAPHLHAFTYNIAKAADALDDCRTALAHFQIFVAEVAEHPRRDEAVARIEELVSQCSTAAEPAQDDERPGKRESRDSTKQGDAGQSMNAAYSEVRSAQLLYEAGKRRFPGAPFAAAARRKKQQGKRLLKLAGKLGVAIEVREFETLEIPGQRVAACRFAERQEKQVSAALDLTLTQFESTRAFGGLTRIRRASERDRVKFGACN